MSKKLKAYQIEYPDGFITNRLIKNPYHKKRGWLFCPLDEESCQIGGENFIPTWDSTDHFHFVCKKCKVVADVLGVKFNPSYGGGVKYALFFYLGCPKCGGTGQRKIYLDISDDACLFQSTYDDAEIFIYGEKREPERKIVLADVVEKWILDFCYMNKCIYYDSERPLTCKLVVDVHNQEPIDYCPIVKFVSWLKQIKLSTK